MFSIVGAYYRFNIIMTGAVDLSWSPMRMYGLGCVISMCSELSRLQSIRLTPNRIAEITVGISCSCIPVAFILFKNMAEKSSTWASHFWYKITEGYLKASDHRGTEEGHINQPLSSLKIDRLPQVPKASMTGLRSFFDKFDRSNTRTRTGSNMEDLDLTIMSGEYEYHQHLRADSTDIRP